MNYGERAVAGFREAREGDVFWELGAQNLAQIAAIAGKLEAERAAKDDAVWLDAGGKWRETKGDALGDFVPGSLIFDIRGVFDAVDAINGARCGKIFPFGGLAVVGELVVARLEVVVGFGEFAIGSDAATNTSAKGEVDALVVAAASLGDGGEVAVVLDKGRLAEIFLELLCEVEVLPREIAEPGAFVVFDDAWHGDAEGDYFAEDEVNANLLAKIIVESVLIGVGGELNRVKDFALFVHEGDEGFGATNVDT